MIDAINEIKREEKENKKKLGIKNDKNKKLNNIKDANNELFTPKIKDEIKIFQQNLCGKIIQNSFDTDNQNEDNTLLINSNSISISILNWKEFEKKGNNMTNENNLNNMNTNIDSFITNKEDESITKMLSILNDNKIYIKDLPILFMENKYINTTPNIKREIKSIRIKNKKIIKNNTNGICKYAKTSSNTTTTSALLSKRIKPSNILSSAKSGSSSNKTGSDSCKNSSSNNSNSNNSNALASSQNLSIKSKNSKNIGNPQRKKYFNKFNSSKENSTNENTVILTLKIKVAKDDYRVFNLKKYDDLFISLEKFFDLNKIEQNLVKPIVTKIFTALNKIFWLLNNKIGIYDQEYLNSLYKVWIKNNEKIPKRNDTEKNKSKDSSNNNSTISSSDSTDENKKHKKLLSNSFQNMDNLSEDEKQNTIKSI